MRNEKREWSSFFLFGLINNIVYVIFLSAAHDIIASPSPPPGSSGKPRVSEGGILLADIVPALVVKSLAPHFLQAGSYRSRIWLCSLLSTLSLLIVAHSSTTSIFYQLSGIVIGSLASGLGECTYLSLSAHYSPHLSIGGWGVGTGGAGLAGALIYWLLSSWMRLGVGRCLIAVVWMPVVSGLAFEFLLPSYHRRRESQTVDERLRLVDTAAPVSLDVDEVEEVDGVLRNRVAVPLSSAPSTASTVESTLDDQLVASLAKRLAIIRSLIFPYMLPLFLVYWAEYSINQGVAPVLLFPLHETPLGRQRDHYVVYQVLYQVGVFISRSSVRWFRIRDIWVLSVVQVGMLLLLASEALFRFMPSIYVVFGAVLVEGLLGGGAYVNAFHRISVEVESVAVREFSMGAVALADSIGITLAGVTAVVVKPWLCDRHPLCFSPPAPAP